MIGKPNNLNILGSKNTIGSKYNLVYTALFCYMKMNVYSNCPQSQQPQHGTHPRVHLHY